MCGIDVCDSEQEAVTASDEHGNNLQLS